MKLLRGLLQAFQTFVLVHVGRPRLLGFSHSFDGHSITMTRHYSEGTIWLRGDVVLKGLHYADGTIVGAGVLINDTDVDLEMYGLAYKS